MEEGCRLHCWFSYVFIYSIFFIMALFFRQLLAKEVLIFMTSTSGLDETLVRFALFKLLPFDTFHKVILFCFIFLLNSNRMNPELPQSRQLNLMQSLEGVQFNTGNFKVMNLRSFCHTLSHALFRWREVLLLDLENVRMKNLKQDSMFVGENELLS